MASTTYSLNKLTCKNWYQWADKYGTHKHLVVYTPINGTFSKSKIWLKIKNKKIEKPIAA